MTKLKKLWQTLKRYIFLVPPAPPVGPHTPFTWRLSDEEARDRLFEECDLSAVRLTGLDQAAIGTNEEGGIVYAYELCVRIFMDQGMSYDEAVEWTDYNVVRAIPYTPSAGIPPIIIYLWDVDLFLT